MELRCHRLPGGMSSTETIVHDPQEVMVLARFRSAYTTLVPRCRHTRVEGPPDWLPPGTSRWRPPSARGDVCGSERTDTPDASRQSDAGGAPAENQLHGTPPNPPEGSMVGPEPTPEPQPEPVSHQQEAECIAPDRIPSMTEAFTTISEALNATRRGLTPGDDPAQAEPSPAGNIGRRAQPRVEEGPGKIGNAAQVHNDRGEQRV